MSVVNGGLGLQLAANTKKGEIAYAVIGAVVVVTYGVLAVIKRKGGGYGLALGERVRVTCVQRREL